MNPDCLIPLLERGDPLIWVGPAAAAGVAWMGLLAVSKYLGKREGSGLSRRRPRSASRVEGWIEPRFWRWLSAAKTLQLLER
jgi:hypothetical protein